MTSNIIDVDFPRYGAVRCAEIGVTFPQLFRVTSYEWDLSADGSELVATDRPAPICYTLGRPKVWKLHANPTFTPISAPDPTVDRGWLIVRHHRTEGQAQGYLRQLGTKRM